MSYCGYFWLIKAFTFQWMTDYSLNKPLRKENWTIQQQSCCSHTYLYPQVFPDKLKVQFAWFVQVTHSRLGYIIQFLLSLGCFHCLFLLLCGFGSGGRVVVVDSLIPTPVHMSQDTEAQLKPRCCHRYILQLIVMLYLDLYTTAKQTCTLCTQPSMFCWRLRQFVSPGNSHRILRWLRKRREVMIPLGTIQNKYVKWCHGFRIPSRVIKRFVSS